MFYSFDYEVHVVVQTFHSTLTTFRFRFQNYSVAEFIYSFRRFIPPPNLLHTVVVGEKYNLHDSIGFCAVWGSF